jgi:hypothetical protein
MAAAHEKYSHSRHHIGSALYSRETGCSSSKKVGAGARKRGRAVAVVLRGLSAGAKVSCSC